MDTKDSSYNSSKFISIYNDHLVTSILKKNQLAKNLTSNRDAILTQKIPCEKIRQQTMLHVLKKYPAKNLTSNDNATQTSHIQNINNVWNHQPL